MTRFMERFQIPLYLAALAVGALAGWWAPCLGGLAAPAVTPVLAALLYVTFLGIPLRRVGEGLRDLRFMACLVIVNFAVVPVIVFALIRAFSIEGPMLIGVLLVLLTPCIDYVIVFAGLAGGSSERLLATAPLLMLAQMLLLPFYLLLFVGPELVSAIEPGPFLEALIGLIIVPLTLAALTQWLSREQAAGKTVMTVVQAMMVPFMMATLAVVIASQIHAVGQEVTALLAVVPLYVAFLVVMVPLGMACARVARLDSGSTRAVIFSGATRNSLVVLPLALALPAPLGLVPLVVVTQTMVELLGMVIYVKAIPRLVASGPILRN